MLDGKRFLICSLIMAVMISGCLPLPPLAGSVRSAPAPLLQPAAHVGGAAVSIAVGGDYAYLGLSHELFVLDVANRAQPRQIAHFPVPATDIALTGGYAYVVGRNGLQIIDIAEPTAPQLLGRWQAERTLAEIAVVGDFAYIVSYSDLYVLAVDDPHAPRVVGHSQLDDRFEGIAAGDGYIYAIGFRGFYTFDIADPTKPRAVDFIETDVSPSGSISMSDYAYFGGEYTLQRMDMSLPSTPTRARSLPMSGWVGDVVVIDNVAYVAAGSAGLEIWDLHNEQRPRRLAVHDTAELATTLVVADGYIYLIDCDEGLQIFDAVDPAHVQKVGGFATLGIAYAVAANDTMAYVASGFNGGLHRIEPADAAARASISAHLPSDNIHAVELAANLLYVIDAGALKIYDVTNSSTPVQLSTYDLTGENDLKVYGHIAYLSNNRGDVVALDISEPARINVIGRYDELGYVNNMTIDNDYLYIAHRDYRLRILSGASAGRLKQIGLYTVNTNVNKVAVQGRYAYLALGPKGVQVVDISDPAQPRGLLDYTTAGSAKDIVTNGRYAFVAADEAGIEVIDMANPRAPAAVARYPTLDCAIKLAMTDSHLYVVDSFGGVLIYALAQADPSRRADYAFVDVNVITMSNDELLPHQTVLIADGRITAMGPVGEIAVPTSAVRIPATGRYLMPGLADMHIHLRDESYLRLLLANGVTTVRNMDGRSEHLLWRAQIANGERLGPRIFTAGPILDELPAHLPADRTLETAVGAAQIVAEQQALGYDFIKVYDGLTVGAYTNIMTAAQAVHLPVVGHIPNGLSAMDAILAGQHSIEHLDGYFGVYADQLPALIQATIDHDVWNCPTLIMLQRMTPTTNGSFTAAQQAMLDYMPPAVLETWWIPGDFADVGYEYRPVNAANLEMVNRLYQAGAPLLLGTDAPMPCAAPGFAVHQELQNLVDAGLTPHAALQTATVNPARFLNRLDQAGTVSVGKQADLVLLGANPLVDISNTAQIVGVIVQGQWLPAAALQQMLDECRSE
ncbi:MAG: amidohydrolase family protein [Caldilineaceae bacterium]